MIEEAAVPDDLAHVLASCLAVDIASAVDIAFAAVGNDAVVVGLKSAVDTAFAVVETESVDSCFEILRITTA